MRCDPCAELSRWLRHREKDKTAREKARRRIERTVDDLRSELVEKLGWSLRGRNGKTGELDRLVRIRRTRGRPTVADITMWDVCMVGSWLDAHYGLDLRSHPEPSDPRHRRVLVLAAIGSVLTDRRYNHRRSALAYEVLGALIGCGGAAIYGAYRREVRREWPEDGGDIGDVPGCEGLQCDLPMVLGVLRGRTLEQARQEAYQRELEARAASQGYVVPDGANQNQRRYDYRHLLGCSAGGVPLSRPDSSPKPDRKWLPGWAEEFSDLEECEHGPVTPEAIERACQTLFEE